MKSIKGINIAGICCCVPSKAVYNKDLTSKNFNIKRIISTIGVKKRHVASANTCTSDLIFKSSNKLIKNLKWKKKDISILIVITQSADYITPATSIILQDRLKLEKSTLTFDVNLGCSGYSHGLSIISSIMSQMGFKKGLLAVGDVSTAGINKNDYASKLLFGDAASVTAVEFDKNKFKNKSYFDYYSDGSGYKDIILPSHSLSGRKKLSNKSFKTSKDINGNKRSDVNIHLNGANVYSFAINAVPKFISNKLKKNTNIKHCFLHQANRLIQTNIEKIINVKKVKFPSSLKNYGNTSSASIPITICENFGGKIFNSLSLLCGFGVGLSMSSAIVNFKNTKVIKILKL